MKNVESSRAWPRVVGVPECARLIGTGPRRVRQMARDGVIRSIRYGRRIVIPFSEVERFLESGNGIVANGAHASPVAPEVLPSSSGAPQESRGGRR